MKAPHLQDLGVRLLTLLDALVKRDGGHAGFTGELAIGVREGERTTWWRARFGTTPVTSFSHDPPQNVDAAVLLGVAEAEAILARGVLPVRPTLLRSAGSSSLMERFLARYARPQSATAIRTGGAPPMSPRSM